VEPRREIVFTVQWFSHTSPILRFGGIEILKGFTGGLVCSEIMSPYAQSNQKQRQGPSKRQIALLMAGVVSLFIPFLLSLVGFFLSLWIVVPAPTMALLPLGVGAPEISPWLMAVNAIALLLAILGLSKSWFYSAALGLSLVGFMISSLPLVQFPSTQARFEIEMQRALGTHYREEIPAPVQIQMRPRPFILADIWRGIGVDPVRSVKGVVFARPDGIALKLNVYQPLQSGTYPVVVVIYGGAWQEGSPDHDETFNQYLAAQGYVVVAVDYRHAPQYQFPAQIEDIKTAIAYIQAHAEEWGIDSTRMALMGRSAGAHLAMLAAYQPDPSPIRAVVNYYGPVDLMAGYHAPPVPDPLDTRAVLRAFLGGTPDERGDLYQQASPVTYVRRSLPPTLLVYGDRDHLVQPRFGKALYEQLKQTGNTAIWLNIPWAEHAFDAVFNGVSNQLALYYTERFLASVIYRGEPGTGDKKE
jgi:acetyl esterase/lipase